IHEHVLRFLTTEHERKGPIYYYVPVLLFGFFPWSAWLPAAVVSVVRSLKSRRLPAAETVPSSTPHFPHTTPPFLPSASLPFLFFSVSGSKLITYILPSVPGLALLLASSWPVRRDT